MNFTEIEPKLSEQSLNTIATLGFTKMTPVQAATIPLFLKNKDVCVEATTGSGKTLAFAVPIYEILSRIHLSNNVSTIKPLEIGALIIAPTRELASQIFEVLTKFEEKNSAFRCGLFVGGTDINSDVQNFSNSGANIVVGTPGRVLDLHKRCPVFKFHKLEVLVLDEADMLLDMGFRDTITQILALLPKQRRTGLFSATQTKDVKDLVRAGMRNPVSISVRVSTPSDQYSSSSSAIKQSTKTSTADSVTQQTTPSTLSNYYSICSYDDRPGRLVQFIEDHINDKIIVFCATCACVDYFSKVFDCFRKQQKYFPSSIPILGFHGKMLQKKRNLIYRKFVGSDFGVLFSTDVAARGVDIPDVDWIVQLTAPKDPAFFVHRVGRTARAGKKGGALLFVTAEEHAYVYLLHGRGVPLLPLTGEDVAPELMVEMKGVHIEADADDGNSDEGDIHENGVGDVQNHDNFNHSKEQFDGFGDHDAAVGDSEIREINQVESRATLSFNKQVLEDMKALAISDRAILEAGSTAFMSFLRAYQEHLCSYLFKFDKLDIGSVARAYALLRLPKIPETRGIRGKMIQFETSTVDTSKIQYKHKERELARKRKLVEITKDTARDEALILQGVNNDSISVSTFSTKKVTNWIPEDEYKGPVEEKRIREKKKSKKQVLMDEWNDLAAEETTFKKFKKGKLSSQEYEKCLLSDTPVDELPASNLRNMQGDADQQSDYESNCMRGEDDLNDETIGDGDEGDEGVVDSEDNGSVVKLLARRYDDRNQTSDFKSNRRESSKSSLDENTNKLVQFWAQKSTKFVKLNKKRGGVQSGLAVSSSDVNALKESLIKTRNIPVLSNNTNAKLLSFIIPEKKYSSEKPSLVDSLSSKNRQKVNLLMQGGRKKNNMSKDARAAFSSGKRVNHGGRGHGGDQEKRKESRHKKQL